MGQMKKCLLRTINSLPSNKSIDWSKLKSLADNKINVTENLKFVLRGVKKIVGKRENTGYQHFLIFPHVFESLF